MPGMPEPGLGSREVEGVGRRDTVGAEGSPVGRGADGVDVAVTVGRGRGARDRGAEMVEEVRMRREAMRVRMFMGT